MTFALATTQSIGGVAGTASAVTYTIFGDEIGIADSFGILAQGQLPISAAALYTVGALKQAIIKTILLANTTNSSVNVVLYANGILPANQIISIPIPAGGEAVIADDGFHVHDANGALLTVGSSSASGSAKNYSARVYARNRWR